MGNRGELLDQNAQVGEEEKFMLGCRQERRLVKRTVASCLAPVTGPSH